MLVSIDRDRVATSELITLEISTSYRAGLVLSSPECVGQSGLSVVDTIRTPARRRSDGAVEQSWTLALEPDLPGPAIAPGLKLAVRDTREGTLAYVTTEPIPVEITSTLDASDPIEVTELRAIPAPPPVGESIWDKLGAIVGGAVFAALVIVAIGAIAVLLIRRRLRGSTIGAARNRVAEFTDRADRMDEDSRTSAIAECSRLLRQALSERAAISAEAMTADEIFAACPQLRSIRDLDSLLPDIERALCSGETPGTNVATSVFERMDRALDELATFIPTGYVEKPEVPV